MRKARLWSGAGAAAMALALFLAWPAPASGDEPIVLAPHRAVYEMSLAAARGGAGVTSVSGRMVYELTGSACEGYTQTMRFVTRLINQEGTATTTDLRSESWEEGSGKRFHFNSSQYRDEKATEIIAGDAVRTRAGDDIKVELTKPAKKDLSLPPGVHFPVQHSLAVLKAAAAGKTIFRADLFDGSEKGEKVYDTISMIGPRQALAANRARPKVENAQRLDQMAAWPVSIAYFEPGSDRRDAVPVYELSFLFFENGVSRKLYIDYGEFAITGALSEITFYPPTPCAQK
jgi:hypothetical protein